MSVCMCVFVRVCVTSVVDDHQLLPVRRHADRGPRQAEHFPLDAADGEES